MLGPAVREGDGTLELTELGRHAIRRAQPMTPLPGFVDASGKLQPGWMVMNATPQLAPPAEQTAQPATAPSYSAALLTTVAAFCETPELSLKTPPSDVITLQGLVDDLLDAVGLPKDITVSDTPETARALREVRRECFLSRNGSRDAGWSLRRAIRQARELIYLEGPAFQQTRYVEQPDAVDDPITTPDLFIELNAAMQDNNSLRVIVAVSREVDFSPTHGGYMRQATASRAAVIKLLGDLYPGRIAAFHPVGFPGRPVKLRTSVAIVDDVYALVGTSHYRRRGLSFDGGADIACLDDDFSEGAATGIRRFRQGTMAAKLGVVAPAPGTVAPADWHRLASPRGAFDLVAALLAEGGLGRIESIWPGPDDHAELTASAHQADPNGAQGANEAIALAGILDTLGAST